VVIATKFGFTFGPTGDQTGMDSRPEHIRQVAEASLKRLRVEAIDLFYTTPCRPERLHRGCGGSGAGPDPGREGEALWAFGSGRANEELGIGFVPFSPLGKGFLTGKVDENTTFDGSDFSRGALSRASGKKDWSLRLERRRVS
jgi:aryl-alcohol dehydrogenase-like predicted oxidoreductase